MSKWYDIHFHRTLAHPHSDYDAKVVNSGISGGWGDTPQDAVKWVTQNLSNGGEWNVFIDKVVEK